MPNSDNKFGTFNKITHIATQPDDDVGRLCMTTFSSVDDAKEFYFTADALAVFDECCTELQWALINDDRGNATSLKWTAAFGTKGTGTARADDWAEQFVSRSQALIDTPLKTFAIQGAVQDGTWVVTITATGHNFTVGEQVYISGVEGMTRLNINGLTVGSVATNTLTVFPGEGFGVGHDYTSGGTISLANKNKWSNNTGSITTSNDHLF
tara:strand:+ start:159 stop:788 length:630 start_codon:yes stop_codon:yes gene_type:complete